MAGLVRPQRALVSVSDKSGLEELAKALVAHGIALVSTGGTAKFLSGLGFDVQDVSALTGFPEMMDGRVKTLHPAVHGGLLARRDNPDHMAQMHDAKIVEIDILIVNLYPFEETVAAEADYDTCIENIDIGGPAMIRAAAKNHSAVTVVVDTEDYPRLIAELDAEKGAIGYSFRQELAQIAYARTASYDAAVSTWFAQTLKISHPRRVTVAGTLAQEMRYGENPHQNAGFYRSLGAKLPGVATAKQIQGKELSYNNINDTDAAFALVSEFDPKDGPVCAIIKHANPCGVARDKSLANAYLRARVCDPISAFGGIVALNQPIDVETAEAITEIFTEVVIAPGISEEAQAVFAKKTNIRVLITNGLANRAHGQEIRQVDGGFLRQDSDRSPDSFEQLETVTERMPSGHEIDDLKFAWVVAKHVKSNAIVYVKDQATVGIGAGQMSRIDSARIAARKAVDMQVALELDEPLTRGAAVASDAFFPFADGLEALAAAGARAVIQPGGAMRDEDVITAANAANMSMVFTGRRHFKH